LSIVIPTTGFVSYLLWSYAWFERHEIESRAEMRSRSLAATVDRELSKITGMAHAFALSDDLAEGDIEGFHKRIQPVMDQTGEAVVISHRNGHQLLNTLRPWGGSETRSVPETIANDEIALATGKPSFSGVFVGIVSKIPLVQVAIPIKCPGTSDLACTLKVSKDAEWFANLLEGMNLPERWSASITDQNRKWIARNTDWQNYVGKRALPAFIKAVEERPEGGEAEFIGPLGYPVKNFFTPVPNSGWFVSVNVPQEALTEPVRCWGSWQS
jgi:hypothetical protein